MNIHDVYRPFLIYFRKKRMRRFFKDFHPSSRTTVLDVGGSSFNWQFLPETPKLFIINTRAPNRNDKNHQWVIADGCYLPFKNSEFDIVYSNSVIEHLESQDKQSLFSSECARVGIRYYIQTPNRRFLIEPHLITPFIHWLPLRMQKKLLRDFTVWGWITRPNQQTVDSFLREVRLLDKNQFQDLFLDAEIWFERFFGLVKSLIAVKR